MHQTLFKKKINDSVKQQQIQQTTPQQAKQVQPKTQKTQPKINQPSQAKTQVKKPVRQNVAPKKLNETPPYKAPQKPTYNPNSAEMLRYKGNLRAAMFKHFPVGNITGSGECSIQFAVNDNGKLINRKFSQESSNKSLNDAVYYMLMNVPTFNPPPSTYSGQTIRMNFKVNNGSYEISIY